MRSQYGGRDSFRSSEEAQAEGLYLAEDHYHEGFRVEVDLLPGDRLPDCPHCGEKISWRYVGKLGADVIKKEDVGRLTAR